VLGHLHHGVVSGQDGGSVFAHPAPHLRTWKQDDGKKLPLHASILRQTIFVLRLLRQACRSHRDSASGSIFSVTHQVTWLVNKAKVEPKAVQGISASFKDTDDARSLYAGRCGRSTGGAGSVSGDGGFKSAEVQ